MAAATNEMTAEQLKNSIDSLEPLGFRTLEEAKKLASHFQDIINHPATQRTPKIKTYLISLDERNRRKFTQKREEVEVEYIYPSDTKNNQQRQRFNSLSVAEVSELLKQEFANTEKSIKVHICTECNVEIETNDEEPLVESLQKHFNLEVHQPKRPEPCDVSEPIVLPNLSRRKSAMVERGEAIAPVTNLEHLEQVMKENLTTKAEKPDKRFSDKLETFLIRNLPDNSEASLNAAVAFYRGIYDHLCKDISAMELTTLAGSVAPIIMSIKDNVDQHFAGENKLPDEEAEDRKNQPRKMRYYGQIESEICRFLKEHKLLTLIDDRTAKPAFFCMACEYYTLRFRYDSVLNHVFNETHIHNLANIIEADRLLPFWRGKTIMEEIRVLNRKFLSFFRISADNKGAFCELCNYSFETFEQSVLHTLDEAHLGRLSDRMFKSLRDESRTSLRVPEEWGQKSPDWMKHLAVTGRVSLARDTVMVENFIKPSGRTANYCPSCDMTLKGPRQVLFNHVRQKKHLRNVAPEKLQYLFKNHCRPAEYYASFGRYYLCTVCTDAPVYPSFSTVVDHVESDLHMQSIARFIKTALYYDECGAEILKQHRFDALSCAICEMKFANAREAVSHALELKHADSYAELKMEEDRKDLIGVYVGGRLIAYDKNAVFSCEVCGGSFASIRSLMMHLVYGGHVEALPSAENLFRFYLELKHNIGLIVRNQYSWRELTLHCGACERQLARGENAKRHTMLAAHRERVTQQQPQEELVE